MGYLGLNRTPMKIALETRKLEIELFWKRSLFYWGFIATALAGYVAVKSDHLLKLIIAHFGLVASFCWFLINKGSKYWQENWEQKVSNIETKYQLTDGLFIKTEPLLSKGLWGASHFSVSKVTIFFSAIVILFWVMIIIYEYLSVSNIFNIDPIILLSFLTTVITLIIITVVLQTCRTTNK